MKKKLFKNTLFNRLLRSNANESTKRWIAIWVSITIIVCSFFIVYKYPQTLGIKVIWGLISYSCILLGMASFETVANFLSGVFGKGKISDHQDEEE